MGLAYSIARTACILFSRPNLFALSTQLPGKKKKPLSLDTARRRGAVMAPAAHPRPAHAPTTAAAVAAAQEADDDVEEGDNAADDGVQDVADAVHDGHEDVAYGAENALDAAYDGAHLENVLICLGVWLCLVVERGSSSMVSCCSDTGDKSRSGVCVGICFVLL